jgi:hypothetical protein
MLPGVLRILGILRNDNSFSHHFYNVDDYDMRWANKDELNSVFAVLLVFFRCKWNTVGNRLGALEILVSDFRSSTAIWCGSGDLPKEVAGVGSDENVSFYQIEHLLSVVDSCISDCCKSGMVLLNDVNTRILWGD